MAAPMLPNGPLQVVFSFDTTGSMCSALKEVRGRLSDMLQRLQTDIPGVTTAVIAHGDYCDDGNPYLIKHVDFTNSLPQLVDFVNNVESTYGGDEPEAYEVMLRLVRKDLTWTPGSQRVLVVIGDAFPHPADDGQNVDKIDWRQETLWLQEMGVRIYGVQVNDSDQSTQFFKTLTDVTEGQHLQLSQFGTLCDVIMAICYREKGADLLHNYEAEVRAREGRKALHKDLENVFGVLKRADSSASTGAAPLLAKSPSVKAPAPTKTASIAKASKTSAVTTAAKKRVARAARTMARSTSGRVARVSKGIKARRLLREKVPNTNFRFSQWKWSPWKLAAVPAGADTTNGQWRSILKGCACARCGAVLGGDDWTARAQDSVMSEVAVQTRPGARRHVVWGRLLPTASASRLSLSRLLASPRVRAQLARVTRNDCRVWVRWARLSGRRQGLSGGMEEIKQQMKDTYDYAWCPSNGVCRDVWVPNGLPSHKVQIAGAMSTD